MGAWRYCPKCGSGMSSPSFSEVVLGKQQCPGYPTCDHIHEVEEHERDFAVDEFVERVERIEALLGISK